MSPSSAATRMSALPPSWMSVPRPAMLVAMVIAPGLPACATIEASCSWWRALSTWKSVKPSLLSRSASCSDFSIEVVPTRTGWPLALGLLDLAHDGPELLLDRAIDLVVLVDALDGQVGRNVRDAQAVDVAEFLGFRLRRAGHAGELGVHAEVVLEGDRGQRLVLGMDLDVFLGLQRLVQAFGEAPARHHAAGELVDDDDLVVADDVVLVALEQAMRLQRVVDVVDDGDVLDVVERGALEHSGFAQEVFELFRALLGEVRRALLLVDLVVVGLEHAE